MTDAPILRGEIAEQPEVVARLLARGGPRVAAFVRTLGRRPPRFVVIAARGTSDNAARYAQYAFGITAGLPVALAAPSLVTLYGARLRLRDALVIGISQSGRSPDIVETVAFARRAGAATLAIVNDAASPLARAASEALPLEAGAERSVAATKTYTAQLTAVALLAAALGRDGTSLAALDRVPAAISRVLARGVRAEVAASTLAGPRAVVLSRGVNLATAFEVSLKLKELARLLAEPYSAADFLHGPIAMAGRDLPVLVVSPPGGAAARDLAALAARLARRGSPVVTIGPRGGAVPLPAVPELLSPIVAVVPGQLLALGAALARGLDPERPLGLQKVTETR